VRFVFCKTDEKLQLACDKLRAYFAAQLGRVKPESSAG
jgi:hypothetical protein